MIQNELDHCLSTTNLVCECARLGRHSSCVHFNHQIIFLPPDLDKPQNISACVIDLVRVLPFSLPFCPPSPPKIIVEQQEREHVSR